MVKQVQSSLGSREEVYVSFVAERLGLSKSAAIRRIVGDAMLSDKAYNLTPIIAKQSAVTTTVVERTKPVPGGPDTLW